MRQQHEASALVVDDHNQADAVMEMEQSAGATVIIRPRFRGACLGARQLGSARRRACGLRERHGSSYGADLVCLVVHGQVEEHEDNAVLVETSLYKKHSDVQTLSDALVVDKANKILVMAQAVAFEEAVCAAPNTPELTVAEASVENTRVKGYGRPRRVFRFVVVRWGTKPHLDVGEAVRYVDGAARANLGQGRGRQGLGRGQQVCSREVNRCVQVMEVTSSMLCGAQESHANVMRVFINLETASDRATERVLRTARVVQVGQFYAGTPLNTGSPVLPYHNRAKRPVRSTISGFLKVDQHPLGAIVRYLALHSILDVATTSYHAILA